MTNVLAEAEAVARRRSARPIVIATIARPTGWTGVHTHFTEFMRVLDTVGHSAALVTPFTVQEKLANAVFAPRKVLARVHPSLNVWWYEQGHFRMLKHALARVLREAGEVTVYAQCPLSAKAALDVRAGPHQRVVMAVHFNGSQADEWANQAGLSPRSSVYTAILRREQRILPALDGIVYLSRYMQRTLENAIPGLPEVPSTVVPNFVPAPEPGARVPTTADLISIGTLEPRKNQAYLLRVVQAANRFGHRYTLTLVGDGPDRAMLESLADDLGVRDQVRFLGFEPNARRLLPAHRAYVHAARFENMPLVLIEALAAGCPVFAPAVGGVPEVYEEGVEGYHWRLEDPNEGARMLIHVLEDAERWELMCQAARRRFDTGFESSAVAERLRRFLIA